MSINSSLVKKFWDARAQYYVNHNDENRNIGNLEDNRDLYKLKVFHEERVISGLIEANLKNKCKALDLGVGMGFWLPFFSKIFKKVEAIDYSEQMLSFANQLILKNKITNVILKHCNVKSFTSNELYDFVFISGILIYMNDHEIDEFIMNMKSYVKKDTVLLIRDGTSVLKDRYIINNKYSLQLKHHYSAIYRTSDELINIFKKIGFNLLCDQNMFSEGHILNKYKETRLRIYVFKK